MLALECPTTEGTQMAADMTRKGPPGVLSAADVADIWTDVARKRHQERVRERERLNKERRERGLAPLRAIPPFREIKASTVLDYLRESQQTPRASGRARRYADHPMPSPAGRMGLMPWWRNSQSGDLVAWVTKRPGRGHGTGGWPAGRPRRRGAASPSGAVTQ